MKHFQGYFYKVPFFLLNFIINISVNNLLSEYVIASNKYFSKHKNQSVMMGLFAHRRRRRRAAESLNHYEIQFRKVSINVWPIIIHRTLNKYKIRYCVQLKKQKYTFIVIYTLIGETIQERWNIVRRQKLPVQQVWREHMWQRKCGNFTCHFRYFVLGCVGKVKAFCRVTGNRFSSPPKQTNPLLPVRFLSRNNKLSSAFQEDYHY